MLPPTITIPETLARVLALLVAADGQLDEPELKMLDSLRAFERIGVSREQFVDMARTAVAGAGTSLSELETLLDLVDDHDQRLLVCRLAAAVITADGHITSDERLVYDHTLSYWHITQSMVTQAILQDHGR